MPTSSTERAATAKGVVIMLGIWNEIAKAIDRRWGTWALALFAAALACFVLAATAGATAPATTSKATPSYLKPVSPKAYAAHTMTTGVARWALQCGNGDCDVFDAIGRQPFVWSKFWLISAHDSRQQIHYGPGDYCTVNFRVYYPNTSNTVYDSKTYQACVA
jgi:hypothetical protein